MWELSYGVDSETYYEEKEKLLNELIFKYKP